MNDAPSPSRRLTRDDWIAFARRTLVKSGVDDVKVDRLARKLKVTRGSFYWHFNDRQELLNALLRDWEARNHVQVAEIRDRWAEAEPDLSDIFALWLAAEANFLDFDIAIRSWARQDSRVSDTVRRVDAGWLELLESLFRHLGYGDEESLVRSRISYFHQIGYHALAFREDFSARLKLVPTYYRALLGSDPDERLQQMLHKLSRKRRRGQS